MPSCVASIKFCSKGEIGFIHSKYIISALPEEEEEERAAPTTRRQLERLHLVFRNTLLMCLAAFPQFPQFNLKKEDLDSFYDWFYGPEMGPPAFPARTGPGSCGHQVIVGCLRPQRHLLKSHAIKDVFVETAFCRNTAFNCNIILPAQMIETFERHAMHQVS